MLQVSRVFAYCHVCPYTASKFHESSIITCICELRKDPASIISFSGCTSNIEVYFKVMSKAYLGYTVTS